MKFYIYIRKHGFWNIYLHFVFMKNINKENYKTNNLGILVTFDLHKVVNSFKFIEFLEIDLYNLKYFQLLI